MEARDFGLCSLCHSQNMGAVSGYENGEAATVVGKSRDGSAEGGGSMGGAEYTSSSLVEIVRCKSVGGFRGWCILLHC